MEKNREFSKNFPENPGNFPENPGKLIYSNILIIKDGDV
jgi:hypothetical protein